ncbi:hypothetical protein JDV02_009106 [Purpureocillium takamizusanense]|uniref:Oxidative stress defense protein n=1 Tax=Purpureocillium takamizusanense TaxID=2060973 RepID=A0A9Q8QP27_9HYPO|nr:uncharacterized protein JDV02_009106 [Purpureocillium takamizusanense]UNI23275.1 hypothetical protein JDV02_009106 [Purpureocillium takamizusanense]
MPPIKVVVSGAGNIKRQPELGVVSVRVLSRGPEQAAVSAEVRKAAQEIQAQVRQLAAPRHADYRAPSPAVDAAVTRWTSGSMTTRSFWQRSKPGDGEEGPRRRRRHNTFYGARTHVAMTSGYSSDSSQGERDEEGGQGEQGEQDQQRRTRVYEASVGLTATFRDFDSLSDFTTRLSVMPLASVRGVDWFLTPETQAQLRDEALRSSYRDALAKARAYAEAMDKKSAKPVEVRQVGNSFPRLMASGHAALYADMRVAGDDDDDTQEQHLTYQPEDVSYDVDCEVTFEVE